MSLTNTWSLIPIGSRLRVKVEVPNDPDGNLANATAVIKENGTSVYSWYNALLRSGNAVLDIASPVDYTVEVIVTSLDIQTVARAEVHASVQLHGGGQRSSWPDPLPLNLKDPLNHTAILLVITDY